MTARSASTTNDDGELVISPLTAEDIPSEAEELRAELERMLPNVPIASLLVEMDRYTGFLDCFVQAGGKQTRSPQLKRNLIACLIGLCTSTARFAPRCRHEAQHRRPVPVVPAGDP